MKTESNVLFELMEIRTNLFKKGNYLINRRRDTIILVLEDSLLNTFEGVIVASSDETIVVGQVYGHFQAEDIEGLFVGSIIVE